MQQRRVCQSVVQLGALAFVAVGASCQSPGAANVAGDDKVRAIPVIAEVVQRGDVPIYFSGLGAVRAFYTATVKSRVDGRIDRVFFAEGQQVKRGQALLQLDPRPFDISLRLAQATLARDTVTLRNNRLNVERNLQLLAKDLIAKQIVTDLQATVDEYEAVVLADAAAVDNAKLQREWSRITAPIDGRTGVRLVDPGNLVHAGDANGLVVITQLDPVAVVFTLPEDELPEVFLQMAAAKNEAQKSLKLNAYSRDGKLSLGQGELLLVDNQINEATGTISLKAIFDNPKQNLWPNQFVRVELQVKILHDALQVPAAAVQHGPHGDYVYTIDSQHVAHVTPVVLHSLQGELAIVESGVGVGTEVVVDGQYKLHDNARIISTRTQKSDDTAAAGAL